MSGRNGLDHHGGTRRHPRPAESAAVRLHDLSRTCARRQHGSLYRRARTAHVRGRAYSRRGFSRPAGRVLRSKHRAAFHDAGDRAARGRVRPSRRRPTVASCSIRSARAMWATRFWWMLKSLGFDNARRARRRARQMEGRKARALETGPAKGYPAGDLHRKTASRIFRRQARTLRPAASAIRSSSTRSARNSTRAWSRAATAGPAAFPAAATCRRRRCSIRRPRPSCRWRTPQQNSRRRASPRTSAWSPIAAAASRPPSICSCSHRLGYDNLTLYDGSMGEWAKDESLPIETG